MGDPLVKEVRGSSVRFTSEESAIQYRDRVEQQTHKPYKIVVTSKWNNRTGDSFDTYYVQNDSNCFSGATFGAYFSDNAWPARQCAEALHRVTGQSFEVKNIVSRLLADIYQVVKK